MKNKQRLPRKAKKIAKCLRDNVLIGQHNALVDVTSLVDVYKCLRSYTHMYRYFIKNADVISYISTCKDYTNRHMYKYMFRYHPYGMIDIKQLNMFDYVVDGYSSVVPLRIFVNMHRYNSKLF